MIDNTFLLEFQYLLSKQDSCFHLIDVTSINSDCEIDCINQNFSILWIDIIEKDITEIWFFKTFIMFLIFNHYIAFMVLICCFLVIYITYLLKIFGIFIWEDLVSHIMNSKCDYYHHLKYIIYHSSYPINWLIEVKILSLQVICLNRPFISEANSYLFKEPCPS